MPHALEGLDDASRERADVGAAVAADLGLVSNAAQCDAPVAASHRTRDRVSERGLADARRAEEQEDRALLVGAQLADGHVLDDALLDLLETVVVLVEHALDFLDLDLVGRGLGPRKIGEPVEVGARDVPLGRLRVHGAHARDLLARDLVGFR